jgi:alkylation response protein AidB-like acyl-CoA dehydrogenase
MPTKINLQAIADNLGPVFAERSGQLEQSDTFVAENYQDLKRNKVFSALVPREYGGGGASHMEMCDFVRSLARHCPSTALCLSMHQHLVSAAVANDKAGRPGRPLLDKVAGSETILISTGANDWLESNGRAEKVEGGFSVTAVKPFASGSPAGQLLVTSAAYDDAELGPQVIHFPCPLSSDGIVFMDDWKTMGMRATGSQTLKLENVFVPDAAIALRRPRGGFHPAFSVILTVALPLIMSAYTGVAEAAAAIARTRTTSRANDPVIALLVGEMETLLTTAQIAHQDMMRLANNFDFEPTVEIASQMLTRKTICAKHVMATCEKALEATGGSGFFRKLGLERFLRDSHGAQSHPLPEKRQQMFTGRHALGLDPVPLPTETPAPAAR